MIYIKTKFFFFKNFASFGIILQYSEFKKENKHFSYNNNKYTFSFLILYSVRYL